MSKENHFVFEVFSIIKKHKNSIIKNFIISIILSIIISLLLPKWYKSTAVILPVSSSNSLINSDNMLSSIGMMGLLQGDDQHNRLITILKSRTFLEGMVNKFGLQEKYGQEFLYKAIEELEENLEIVIEDEGQISISLIDKDQDMVGIMTNYSIQLLDSLNRFYTSKHASKTREFISDRMLIVKDSINIIQEDIITFMKNNNVLILDEQIAEGLKIAADLKAEILLLEIQLSVSQKTSNPNNSKVRELKNRLFVLKNKYDKLFTDRNNSIYFPDFENIPTLKKKEINLQFKLKYYLKLLEFLGPQLEQAKLDEAKNVPLFQIVDRAFRPEKKLKPKRSLIVIALTFLSLFFNILYLRVKYSSDFSKTV